MGGCYINKDSMESGQLRPTDSEVCLNNSQGQSDI